MKTVRMWPVVVLLVMTVGCSGNEGQEAQGAAEAAASDVGAMAREGADAVATMFEGSRDEVVSRSEKALADLDAAIKELEGKAAGAQGEAKDQMDKAVASMKEQYKSAADHLAKMKDSTEDTWNDAVNGFKGSFGELQKSMKEIAGK